MGQSNVRVPCPTSGCAFSVRWTPDRAGKRAQCNRCKAWIAIPVAEPQTGYPDPAAESDPFPDLDVPAPPPAYAAPPAAAYPPPAYPPAPVGYPYPAPGYPPPAYPQPVALPTPYPAPVAHPAPPAFAVVPRPGAGPTPTGWDDEPEDAGAELDRRPQHRRPARAYFSPPAVWPFTLFSWALFLLPVALFTCVLVVIPIGLVVVGLLGLLLGRSRRWSDGEMVAIIREDRRVMKAVARRRVRAVLREAAGGGPGTFLPGWSEPLVFAGPVYRTGPGAEPYDRQARQGDDGRVRYARSNVMVLGLGSDEVVTYRVTVNHATGNAEDDQLCEFYNQDVVTVEARTESARLDEGLDAYLADKSWGRVVRALTGGRLGLLNPLTLLLKVVEVFVADCRREVVQTRFALYTTGATAADVAVDTWIEDDAAANPGALGRTDRDEEVAIRNRIREVKSLLRRDVSSAP